MKLIHFSDTHFDLNDVNILQNTNNRLYTSNSLTYLKTILLKYDLLLEILEAFHTIKEQYKQIFLISHEMEIKYLRELWSCKKYFIGEKYGT